MFDKLLSELKNVYSNPHSSEEEKDAALHQALVARDEYGCGVFSFFVGETSPKDQVSLQEFLRMIIDNKKTDEFKKALFNENKSGNDIFYTSSCIDGQNFLKELLKFLGSEDKKLLREILNHKYQETTLISFLLNIGEEDLLKDFVMNLLLLDEKDCSAESVEAELAKLKKINGYCSYARLTYAVDIYRIRHLYYLEAKKNILNDLSLKKEAVDLMKSLVEKAAKHQNEVFAIRGNDYKIIHAGISGHAAFFVIKYDSEKKIEKVFYCDGNAPFSRQNDSGKAYNVCAFEVDDRKTVEEIENILRRRIGKGKDELKDKVYSVAKKGVATELSYSIFSSVQKRGNCSQSSSNILLKLLLKEHGWNFERTYYGKDVNGQDIVVNGAGYEDFKEIKKAEMDLVMNFLTAQNLSEVSLEAKLMMMNTLQQMFLQAVKKGNFKLLGDIAKALQTAEADFNFNEIKDLSGRNAMFFVALSKDMAQAFKCCYDEYNINTMDCDRYGVTPAVFAIRNGNVKFVVETLIKKLFTSNAFYLRDALEESEDEEQDGHVDKALKEVKYLLDILSQKVDNRSLIEYCADRKDASKAIEETIEECKKILARYSYLSSGWSCSDLSSGTGSPCDLYSASPDLFSGPGSPNVPGSPDVSLDCPPTKVARVENSVNLLNGGVGGESRSI